MSVIPKMRNPPPPPLSKKSKKFLNLVEDLEKYINNGDKDQEKRILMAIEEQAQNFLNDTKFKALPKYCTFEFNCSDRICDKGICHYDKRN